MQLQTQTMESVAIKVEIDEFNDQDESSSSNQQSTPSALHKNKDGDIKSRLYSHIKSNKFVKVIKHTQDDKPPEGNKRRGGRPKKSDVERKLQQVERARRFRAKNVNIGDQVERWAFIRCMTNTENNSDVAKLLIDFYVQHHPALARIPGNPFSESGQAKSCVSGTNDCDNKKMDLPVDACRIKVEEPEEEISNDALCNEDESLAPLPDLKNDFNTDRIKEEIIDSDYNKALSSSPNSVCYCNHKLQGERVESQDQKHDVLKQQCKPLEERKKTGIFKRKALPDAISNLKFIKMEEIQ